MNTWRYLWRRRSWKLAGILYRAYAWPVQQAIIYFSLILTYLMLTTDMVWVRGWGGR